MKTYDDVMERAAERKAAAQARKIERAESGVVNALVIEQVPNGLYQCRYSQAGPVPEELKGLFTHKKKVLDICARRNIPVVS